MTSTTLPDVTARIENAKRISAAMRAVGIESMQVEYSGSGDSGENWSASVTPEMEFPEVLITTLRSLWDYSTSTRVPSEVTHSLENAFRDFAETWIDDEHAGYENGDGGFGTVTLFASGAAELDHSDYIVETCNCFHEMAASAPEVTSLPSPPALLMLAGPSAAATTT